MADSEVGDGGTGEQAEHDADERDALLGVEAAVDRVQNDEWKGSTEIDLARLL
jgi:hypothetical protein